MVRGAYTAPLAPVTPTAMLLRRLAGSVDIDRHRRRRQVQEAYVAVEIECALDLRQVVLADERLLVDEQPRNPRDPGEIDAPEAGQGSEGGQADHGEHV